MQDLSWAAGKKSMGNVDAFLRSLLTFNKDAIPLPCVEKCEKDYISNRPSMPPTSAPNQALLQGSVVGSSTYASTSASTRCAHSTFMVHATTGNSGTYPVNASCLRSMRNNVVLLLSYQEVSSSKPKSFPLNAGGGTQACRLGGGKQEAE